MKLPGKRECKNRTLTVDQEHFLVDIFQLSDMTYAKPGRKRNLYIGKINCGKAFVQKGYLLEPQRCLKDTIKACFWFRHEFPWAMTLSRLLYLF